MRFEYSGKLSNGTVYDRTTTAPTNAGEYTFMVFATGYNNGNAVYEARVKISPKAIVFVLADVEIEVGDNAKLSLDTSNIPQKERTVIKADLDIWNSDFEIYDDDTSIKLSKAIGSKGIYTISISQKLRNKLIEIIEKNYGINNYKISFQDAELNVKRASSGSSGGSGGSSSSGRTSSSSSSGTSYVQTPITTTTPIVEQPKYVNVIFDANNGTTPTTMPAVVGDKLDRPGTPHKDGLIFTGWYTDKMLTNLYDFSSIVSYGFTLYGGWEKDETFVPKVTEDLPFTDVYESDWYVDTVRDVYEKGIMTGMYDGYFMPNENLTRAMLVTTLYRLEDVENQKIEFENSKFYDVPADSWFTKPVAWASSNNIVSGMLDGGFAPSDNITREQITTIVYRFAQYKGKDNSSVIGPSYIVDETDISPYAKTAINWAMANGILTGYYDGSIKPQNYATRAEVAVILSRVSKYFGLE